MLKDIQQFTVGFVDLSGVAGSLCRSSGQILNSAIITEQEDFHS